MKRLKILLACLLAVKPEDIAAFASSVFTINDFVQAPSTCRSNSTHVVWKLHHSQQHQQQVLSIKRTEHAIDMTGKAGTAYQCVVQTRKAAVKTCKAFLKMNTRGQEVTQLCFDGLQS